MYGDGLSPQHFLVVGVSFLLCKGPLGLAIDGSWRVLGVSLGK